MKFAFRSRSYSGSPGCGRPSMKDRNSSGSSSNQSPNSLVMRTFRPIMRWLNGVANPGFHRSGDSCVKSTWRPRGRSSPSSMAAPPPARRVGEREVAELGDDVAVDVARDVPDVDDVVLAVGTDSERRQPGERR